MLRITVDVYSGRPNPTADVTDPAEVRAVLNEMAQVAPATAADPSGGGLGLRGFRVEPLGDEIPVGGTNAPGGVLYLPAGSAAGGGSGTDLAQRMLDLVQAEQPATDLSGTPTALDAGLKEYLLGELAGSSLVTGSDGPGADRDDEPSAQVTCSIEFGTFNPGFWNDDPTVRANNNCYNYASNWRTNTFAQPGRGCGRQYTAITCAEVSRGAMCDGMHRRFDCFPDSEKPRYLVALVIAPGPGFVDYHWFRKQSGNFWGHKPGGTAARNVDNSNRLITNPETANRGPYTVFCGYFYGCNSQRMRIR